MKKLKYLIITCLCFSGYSQDLAIPVVIPPSPETASMAEKSSVNIGLFTGTLQYSVDLYKIEGQYLSLPISLSYATNGVKVNDMSTWAGTDWNLNAGGVITRSINYSPDEFSNIMDLTESGCFSQEEFSYLKGFGNSPDYASDLFSCNFLGNSFDFYLDNFNQPQFVELTDWKISYNVSEQKFTLTDTNGTIYEFGGGNDASNNIGNELDGYYTEYSSIGSSPDFDSGITAWHLKSITHYTGEVISFTYKTRYMTYTYDRAYSKRKIVDYGDPNNLCLSQNVNTHTTYLKAFVLYLDKITSKKDAVIYDEVSFYSINRANVNLKSKILTQIVGYKNKINLAHDYYNGNQRYFLREIEFRSKNNDYLNTYQFEYDNPNLLPSRLSNSQDLWGYFNQATNINLLLHHPVYFPNENANRDLNEITLKYGSLKKITYPTKGVEEFEYDINHWVSPEVVYAHKNIDLFQEATNSIATAPTIQDQITFTALVSGNYKLSLIAERHHNKLDGNHYSSNIQYELLESGLPDEDDLSTNHSILNDSFNSSNTLILEGAAIAGRDYKLIIYATGSEAEYHVRIDYPIGIQDVKKYTGGIILSKRITKPIIGENQTKLYNYYDAVPASFEDYFTFNNALSCSGASIDNYLNYSSLDRKEYGSNARDNFYGKVIEKIPNHSVIEHNFQTVYKTPIVNYVLNTNPHHRLDKVLVTGAPKEIRTIYQKFDDSNSIFKDVKKIENLYGFKVLDIISVSYFRKFNHYDSGSSIGSSFWENNDCIAPIYNQNMGVVTCETCGYIMNKYYLRKFEQKLIKVIETDYINNSTQYVQKVTDYFYNSFRHNQVTLKFTRNSINDTLKTKYYYPKDIPSEPFVTDLVAKNIIAFPIKTQTYKNSEKLSENLTEYTKTNNNLLLPKYIYANKGVNDINKNTDKKITYDQYDTNGTILQYTPENGAPVTFIWGYNKTQPIAKIENATYSSITPSLITAAQTESDTGTEASLLTALNKLRNHTAFATAMVTTYTHIPLIGVSTITDPKGDKITYQYDEFNRLKSVKDKNGNILSENEYHYKN